MRILVPLNGTPKSESVIPFATNLALRWKAEIVTLKVVDPLEVAGTPSSPWLRPASIERRWPPAKSISRIFPRALETSPFAPFAS